MTNKCDEIAVALAMVSRQVVQPLRLDVLTLRFEPLHENKPSGTVRFLRLSCCKEMALSTEL